MQVHNLIIAVSLYWSEGSSLLLDEAQLTGIFSCSVRISQK
jgi:hypothetical protein